MPGVNGCRGAGGAGIYRQGQVAAALAALHGPPLGSYATYETIVSGSLAVQPRPRSMSSLAAMARNPIIDAMSKVKAEANDDGLILMVVVWVARRRETTWPT